MCSEWGAKIMTAMIERARSANEWVAVLNQVEISIARSLRDVNRQAAFVFNEPIAGVPNMDRVQSRLDQRIRELSERVAEAERSAEIAGAELAAAEAELRQWIEQMGGIAKQVDIVRSGQ